MNRSSMQKAKQLTAKPLILPSEINRFKMGYGQFNIELERGQAKKAYSELTHEEQVQLGKDLFEQIKADLAKRGQEPITSESIKRKTVD